MTKKILMIGAFAMTFALGYSFNAMISPKKMKKEEIKRVTGIGGIFFKCKDPKKLREWYRLHLGFSTNDYGAVFEWKQAADSTKKGFSQWSPFSEKTKYFAPSTKDFMMNYRVADLEALVMALKAENVAVVDTIETYDYGKFVHILDLEGNKIELWQPNDMAFDQLGNSMGYTTIK
jgi:predicted enzyme related to lactoylglutathione lyase